MAATRGPLAVLTVSTLVAAVSLALCLGWFSTAAATPPPPHLTEHPIKVDATALNPPGWWHVPGVTPMIMTMDPDSTDAFRTTQAQELKLRPGDYRFGTFTFDFPFTVTIDGVLEYAKALDQCVQGRGTKTLSVTCSRMQPYGGKRDYQY